MTETTRNPENSDRSPFREEIAVENFFAAAARGAVLSQINEAVADGTALIVLTGEEGSGKTMMCRMLEQEYVADLLTVFFPRTVESFEDVVRIVAMRLGIKLTAAVDGKGVGRALENIIAILKTKNKRLLVIFDEAENIYLATLERIRKMVDQITEAGAHMHILFAGRKPFLENCEQLTICDFKNTDEVHFELGSMSEEETGLYLKQCSEYLGDLEKAGLFDDETVKNIYAVAKGNFRMTNILAEESLKTHGEDTSFMVLLDSVKGEAEADGKRGKTASIIGSIGRYSSYFPWIGGGILCLIVVLFLIMPDDEQGQPELSASRSEKALVVKKQPSLPAVPHPAKERSSLKKDVAAPVKAQAVQEDQHPEKIKSPTAPFPEAAGSQEAVKKGAGENNIIDVVIEKPVQSAKIAQKKKITVGAAKTIIAPRQILPLNEKVMHHRTSGSGNIHVQPRTEVQGETNSVAQFTVDQLFENRVLAGAAWAGGNKDHKYTVQLMVLTAENAEKNLKKMLSQKKYRNQAGHFYIFRKFTPAEVIFVFYGEYPTIAEARTARNSIVPFLRKHKPYAISIKGAMAKVKKW